MKKALVMFLIAGIAPPGRAGLRSLQIAGPSDLAYEHLQRGEAHADARHYDQAIAEYQLAIQLKPDYAEAYNDRGHAYYWTGEKELAIADFTRAIALRPEYPNAYNNRGAAYMASGHAEKGIPDFDRAIALKPDFRNAYVNRANARLLRHPWLALNDFHRAGMHPERQAGVALLMLIAAGVVAFAARRRHRAPAATKDHS